MHTAHLPTPLLLVLLCLIAPSTAAAEPPAAAEQTVVFIRTEGRAATDIWTMRGDGKNQKPLRRTPDLAEYDPALSPDGKTIAFVGVTKDEKTGAYSSRLMTLPLNDGEPGKATVHTDDEMLAYGPVWSPDGKSIAVTRFPREKDLLKALTQTRVEVIELKTGKSRGLSKGTVLDWHGDRLLIQKLTSKEGQLAATLHTMNADGEKAAPVEAVKSMVADAAFSPDGKRLACAVAKGHYGFIEVIELDGGKRTPVSEPHPTEGGSFSDAELRFSRDGKAVFFTRFGEHSPAGFRIHRFDLAKKQRVTLTEPDVASLLKGPFLIGMRYR